VEGRTADDAAYWLAGAPPAWRDAVQVVAIDMCSIYASAVRRALPYAQLVVDLFHVVQLAVKMTGDVRRRAVREKYERRGREQGMVHNFMLWDTISPACAAAADRVAADLAASLKQQDS
jgi:transposase